MTESSSQILCSAIMLILENQLLVDNLIVRHQQVHIFIYLLILAIDITILLIKYSFHLIPLCPHPTNVCLPMTVK